MSEVGHTCQPFRQLQIDTVVVEDAGVQLIQKVEAQLDKWNQAV